MRKMFSLLFVVFFIACSSSGSDGPAATEDSGPTNDVGTDTPVGCVSAAACDDGFNCTIDSCFAGKCSHTIGPQSGPTACAPGEYCTLLKGCVKGKACAKDGDCTSDDPCVTGGTCDSASSVCVYKTLDKDGDGHPPPVCGGDDCDDGNPTVYPGAIEICDGKDNNCNTKIDDGATCRTLALGGGYYKSNHSCARKSDGTVYCWGDNSSGQLGGGMETYRPDPKPVVSLTDVGEVFAASGSTCVRLNNGSVKCWGSNTYGQVGNNSTKDASTPVPVLDILNVVDLSLGGTHACALLVGGIVNCWGTNKFNELGTLSGTLSTCMGPTPCALKPIMAGTGPFDIVNLNLGAHHTCGRTKTGTVKCWGDNEYGQLGYSSTDSCTFPAGKVDCSRTPTVLPDLSGVIQIALGGDQTCALLGDGTVKCWGLNQNGSLGYATTTTCPSFGWSPPCSKVPTAVPGLSGVTSLSVGTNHVCALLGDGTVKCWGGNMSGQIGDGTTTDRAVPTSVSGLSKVVEIATGPAITCARLKDDSIVCWGSNDVGQLGNGTVNYTPNPLPIPVKW